MFGHGCGHMFGHGCSQRVWSRVWSHFGYGCGHRACSKGVVIGRDQARGCDQGCGHMLGLSAWSLGAVKGCCQMLCIKGVVMCVFIVCGHCPWPIGKSNLGNKLS